MLRLGIGLNQTTSRRDDLSMDRDAVFPPEWIEKQWPRWSARSERDPAPQQLLVGEANRAGFRQWIEHEVGLLRDHEAGRLIPRLRSEEHFLQTVNELGVAALLRSCGFDPRYEVELAGLTPDWLIHDGAGERALIEVVTRMNPQVAERRRWHRFAGRVETIELGWGVHVGPPTVAAPDDRVAKHHASLIRSWLRDFEGQAGATQTWDGYTYRIAGPTQTGSAMLLHPSPEAGPVDHDVLVNAIRSKVDKYRELCEELQAALLVVVASDALNGHSADSFKRSLTSVRPSATITFGEGDVGLLADQTFSLEDREPPSMPFHPSLSDVAFLDLTLEKLRWTLLGIEGRRPLPASLLTDASLRPVA